MGVANGSHFPGVADAPQAALALRLIWIKYRSGLRVESRKGRRETMAARKLTRDDLAEAAEKQTGAKLE